MRDYVIVTDSSADYNAEMVKKLNIDVVPLKVNISGEVLEDWYDGRDISPEVFYKKLRAGEMASTSQINTIEFSQTFSKYLDEGKDVLYIGFSSGLSGTFNAGRLAADDLQPKYPDAKILVVDTLAASLGQGLLVWHAVQLKNQGKTIEEVQKWLEENKLHMAHWFTVDDLSFLKRGGRISGATAIVGSLLQIKPVMHMDNGGHLIPVSKVRGRKQSLDALVDRAVESGIDIKSQQIFISHGDSFEDASYVGKEMKRRCGVKDVFINFVGPVIGSHSGPGTIALFFLAKER